MRESASRALQRRIVRLHGRRGRQKLGLLLLEGEKVLRLALQVGLRIEAIVADREHEELLLAYPQALLASAAELATLATTATAPPIVAVARLPPDPPPLELAAGGGASAGPATRGLLALDGIRDPGNLGTLLRTAQAFGLGGVVLGSGVVDRWSPKVVRGSMGAVLTLPAFSVEDLAAWLRTQSEHGLTVYLAETAGGLDPATVARPGGPWCLVLGGEADGLSAPVRAVPATPLTLPIEGEVGSLSVAAAGAVLLYLLRCGRAQSIR